MTSSWGISHRYQDALTNENDSMLPAVRQFVGSSLGLIKRETQSKTGSFGMKSANVEKSCVKIYQL